jgi:putative phosphoribosyl transferase
VRATSKARTESLTLVLPGAELAGELTVPDDAVGIVLFAQGSGSSRTSPRNRSVAEVLHAHRIATLLFDLLTESETMIDDSTQRLRFDIGFLARRLVATTNWIGTRAVMAHLPIGYFGASTGAAAALVAAAAMGSGAVTAIVSCNGRPDLVGTALRTVRAATLLIVDGNDHDVVRLNERAYARLTCKKELVLLDEELDEVARLAAEWFDQNLVGRQDVS